MLTITDLKGDEHVLTCIKTRKKELNGNDELQLIIHQQQNRTVNLIDVSEMWIINYQTVKFKIVYLERVTRGNSFYLNVRAIPLFYDEFATSIIHYVENGSITANDVFSKIFNGTNFTYVLSDNSSAQSWDGFGKGENRLNLFKKALDKFGYEFYIVGNVVYMKHLIGNDTNFMYKYKLNASDVKQSVDATELYTHIKGFGDIADGEEDYLNASKLKREYTSDLANLIGIREAPPVIDGRIKTASTLDEKMKAVVDNSLNVSVTAKLHDLRKQGYDVGVPVLGDRTFLIDERINVNIEIRVYALEEKYDEKDNLKDCKITFGSQGIGQRYTAKINDISNTMMDILNGRVQLPFDVLDTMAKSMLLKIQSVSSELVFSDQGIFAIDKSNPNNVVGLNSAGWFISTDGGRTAKTVATADGIVADAITTGSLNASLITTGELSADRIRGGLLTSRNGNMSLNLDTGDFVINSSRITYTSAGNALKYTSGGWTSGILFMNDTDGNSSMVLGSSNTAPDLDNNSASFTGFKSVPLDQSAQIWGKSAIFVDKQVINPDGTRYANTVWKLEISDNSAGSGTRSFFGTGTYAYYIGRDSNYLSGVFTKKVNEMKAYTNGLSDSSDRNGFYYDDDTVYFKYKGKAYDIVYLLRSAGFSV